MSYASRIKERKLKGGGRALFAAFPAHPREYLDFLGRSTGKKISAHGEISITGSLAGGAHLAQGFLRGGVGGSSQATARGFSNTLSGDALSDMHAAMLLEGTKKRTKNEIQILLDTIGASLSFSADKDRLVFHARVRAVHADKLLALISECLCIPAFPQEEMEHLKARMLADLSLEAQNPHAQASINLSRMLFAQRHPNRHEDTAQSKIATEKMTRKELQSYHANAIDSRSLIVSIAGLMKKDDAFALLEKRFSKLPKRELAIAPFAPAKPVKAKKIVAPIPDKASIDYMLGTATGITHDHPDYPALMLGLQVLGSRSGFTGRLMKTVREEEGLTYAAYAYPGGFSSGADGYAAVSATFAPELFERGRAAVMREIKKLVEDGPTGDEVKRHREMYEARSRVLCANSADLSRVAHDITVEKKRPLYLDEFPKRILKLTRAQVHKALKKYLVIENLSESVAGPIAEIKG